MQSAVAYVPSSLSITFGISTDNSRTPSADCSIDQLISFARTVCISRPKRRGGPPAVPASSTSSPPHTPSSYSTDVSDATTIRSQPSMISQHTSRASARSGSGSVSEMKSARFAQLPHASEPCSGVGTPSFRRSRSTRPEFKREGRFSMCGEVRDVQCSRGDILGSVGDARKPHGVTSAVESNAELVSHMEGGRRLSHW
eukprot:CAMPEP_0183331272 /NCGR_PEP_ID=MMETSP0164_2-20130417/649_1 /TAXON_ID=221442 /ORGANISM="Coccolithus pelagicus ssp braarudi, Strain PLY182g" /LENGTH=198 /DNA_ID=CAMNT_0025499697 /DNA_START=584 /DNA_END=1177 /DNA_ORIENTATION=-